MPLRKPLVAGNWKMHGDLDFIASFAAEFRVAALVEAVDVLLLPPACYIQALAGRLDAVGVAVGAQNVHWQSSGAVTGEIAPQMVRELGARWALVGHSERRALFGETDEQVADKFAAALAADLRPILCVGESLAEREAGSAEAVVARQLDVVFRRVGADGLSQATIAYEPVWAIGTGLTATPEQAQSIHAHLRSRLLAVLGGSAQDLRLLYGGSVTPENARALFAQKDIDGVLVGGASLAAERLLRIVEAASSPASV